MWTGQVLVQQKFTSQFRAILGSIWASKRRRAMTKIDCICFLQSQRCSTQVTAELEYIWGLASRWSGNGIIYWLQLRKYIYLAIFDLANNLLSVFVQLSWCASIKQFRGCTVDNDHSTNLKYKTNIAMDTRTQCMLIDLTVIRLIPISCRVEVV